MEVLVIGAGLAGLYAAGLALRQGHEVTILESSERLGGRVRTEAVDGFLCDRGFQLLNPGYPEVKRALELVALDLHASGRGVAVRNDRGIVVLADPLRHPSRIPELFGGTLALADLRAMVRWIRLARDGSRTLRQSTNGAGFSDPAGKVVQRFFAGVVGDTELEISAPFALKLAGYFAKAIPSLPAQGMGAIAHQLAEPVENRIRFSTGVESLSTKDGRVTVHCTSGERLSADRVVVAAGPRASARLTGQPEPAMNSITTWWFAATKRPSGSVFLHVDVREGARLVHVSVISNICPSYAPAGRHLVQATAVGEHGVDDVDALAQAADILGVENPDWQLLVRHDIPDALPAIKPGHCPLSSTLSGVIIAGDTAEASIQGALASGAAAAAALGAERSAGSRPGSVNDTFTVELRMPGNAQDLWKKLIDLDAHTAAIPFATVSPAASHMHEGLEFVGLTRVGAMRMTDRMMVRQADPPGPGTLGNLAVSKFGPVAGEVHATVEQAGANVVVTWSQSLRPAWLPRRLRPLGAVIAQAGYRIALRKLLASR